ncbi:MAG: helix-turn-helix transcriptional regulator [Oscillospiraceae bacterium]|nr:helix-turn-helix transcriptional regulator [Oscillospiraceae bacterium]
MFGAYVKEKRIEANLTQEQLGERMGVSVNAVQNWESGKNKPKKDRLADLAKHLDVDANELESAYYDDGEDFSNFPSFMYTDEQNKIISTLRLTPEQKEFMMLIRIYNSDNWDRVKNKLIGWDENIMEALRRIPYKYTEEKGVFRVYELGLHLSNFLEYVPASFCFEMIRSSPDTVFDIRTLDKKTILKWMDLRTFGGKESWSYSTRALRDFKERIEKLDKWGYRERREQRARGLSYTSTDQLIETVFDDANYTITTRLTPTGVRFKEWSSDIT